MVRRLAAGGSGPPTNDQAKKSGAVTPRDPVVVQFLRRDVRTLPLRQRLRARAREFAVEWRDINGLVPYAGNARTHSEAQIAQIAGSIREFGFTNPVSIDPEGGIFGQFTSLPASMIRPPSPTC
jgi:hypothetical protein